MPIRRRRVARKRPARKARRAPARRAHTGLHGSNIAKIAETQESVTFNANTPQLAQFSITDFPRASAVATNFKWYRATHVTYTYNPEYNVFQEGSGVTKPYFYSVMVRDGNPASAVSQAILIEQGAKPRSFASQVKLSYKPNLTQVMEAAYLNSDSTTKKQLGIKPVFNAWINTATPIGQVVEPVIVGTQPAVTPEPILNNVQYYGHGWNVSAANASALIGYYSVTVHWEFKEPNAVRLLTQ